MFLKHIAGCHVRVSTFTLWRELCVLRFILSWMNYWITLRKEDWGLKWKLTTYVRPLTSDDVTIGINFLFFLFETLNWFLWSFTVSLVYLCSWLNVDSCWKNVHEHKYFIDWVFRWKFWKMSKIFMFPRTFSFIRFLLEKKIFHSKSFCLIMNRKERKFSAEIFEEIRGKFPTLNSFPLISTNRS